MCLVNIRKTLSTESTLLTSNDFLFLIEMQRIIPPLALLLNKAGVTTTEGGARAMNASKAVLARFSREDLD